MKKTELKPKAFIYGRVNYLLKRSGLFQAELWRYAENLMTVKKEPKNFSKRRLSMIKNLDRLFCISPSKEYENISRGILLELLDEENLSSLSCSWLQFYDWKDEKLQMPFSPSFKVGFNESRESIVIELKSPISRGEFEDLGNHIKSLQDNFLKTPSGKKKWLRSESKVVNFGEDLSILHHYLKSGCKPAEAEQKYLKLKAKKSGKIPPKVMAEISKELNFNYKKDLSLRVRASYKNKNKRFDHSSIEAVANFKESLDKIKYKSSYFKYCSTEYLAKKYSAH